MKYITCDRSQGIERYYLRLPGRPGKVRIRGEYGSAEFEANYNAALKNPAAKPGIGANRTIAGTINQLIVSLYGSRLFAAYAGSTRDSHRWRLERLRNKHGTKPARDFDKKHVHEMLAKLEPVNQKNWIKTLRILYRHAIATGLAESDPTAGYKLPKIESAPHRRWEEEDIAQYEACHPIGTKARLAFALLRYTGLRKSDIVRLGPQHIRRNMIVMKTQKTGKTLSLPLMPELAEIIAATKVIGATSFLVTKHGKPHGVKGFGNYMREWCNEAGLPDLSAHGMRHAVGASMGETGASVPEIMAVLGHNDPRMAMHYVSQANQAKLATSAFAKLMGRKEQEA